MKETGLRLLLFLVLQIEMFYPEDPALREDDFGFTWKLCAKKKRVLWEDGRFYLRLPAGTAVFYFIYYSWRCVLCRNRVRVLCEDGRKKQALREICIMYGQETSIVRRLPIFTNHDGAGNDRFYPEGLVPCEDDPLDARGGFLSPLILCSVSVLFWIRAIAIKA